MKYEGMPRPDAKAKEPSLDTGRDINRINRVQKTYTELLEQPATFWATINYTKKNLEKLCSDLVDKKINRVILLGCGDSWFVGTCLEVVIEKLLGCICQSFDAFEFYAYHCKNLDSKTIVIGQSASGTTASVLNSINEAKQQGAYTIGISNTPDAKILNYSDFGLLVQAARKGWPTQATTAAIGAIACLFATLAKEKNLNPYFAQAVLNELDVIPQKMNKTISLVEGKIKTNIKPFIEDFIFQTTGCGPLFGAAQVAGAKLKELCPVHAFSYPLEEFHHYRSLKPNDPLILFLSDSPAYQKEIDTALVGAYDGGKIVVVGPIIDSAISKVADLKIEVVETLPELQSILSMIGAHLFAYYLAINKYEANIGYPSEE